jgi:hypothetical protein
MLPSAFVAPAALPSLLRAGSSRDTCATCAPLTTPMVMKGKGSRKPAARRQQKKSEPKPTAPASETPAGAAGKGFGTKDAVVATESDGGDDVIKSKGSGKSGDVTPHGAFIPGGRATLEDPLRAAAAVGAIGKGSVEDASAPSAPRPDGTSRWPWSTTNDKAVELLAAACAEGSKALEIVVASNRDFITERMLYRFTSAILQAESESTPDAAAEATAMRELRKDIIRICWDCDRPLRDELFPAEARLVTVLQSAADADLVREVRRSCGNTSISVNAFWLVVYAAVAAWESREGLAAAASGSEEDRQNQAAVQQRLKDIADAIPASQKMTSMLSPALSTVGTVLTASDPADQAAAIANLDSVYVAEMASILEQIRLWPQGAYSAFVQKLQAIVDYALTNMASAPVPKLEPFRFEPTKIVRSSRLIDFQRRNSSKRTF